MGTILYHPKHVLGFEAFVAPANFDRKAQDVDIYNVFEKYYRNHRTARAIYSISNSATTHNLSFGTSYVYAYTSGGIDYITQPLVTLVRTAFSGVVTSVPVNDTTGFPATGTISVNGSAFIYTSITSNTFVGGSQNIGLHSVGESVCSQIALTGTKRWVIINNATTTLSNFKIAGGAEWLYIGNTTITGIDGNIYASASIKYLHAHNRELITSITNFTSCSLLSGKLTLPNIITTLAAGLFKLCTGLTSVEFGNALTTLTASTSTTGVFYGCSGMTGALVIPNSLVTIGAWTFSGCKFTSLYLGDHVQTIGVDSFLGCLFTGTITIPASVTSLSGFNGITGITGINTANTIDIPSTVTTIGDNAFRSCTGLTGNILIQDTVTTIGNAAFYSLTNVTGTLTFENPTTSVLTSIGDSAFYSSKCTGTLVLPNSLITIGLEAFYSCLFTGSLTIPNNVTTINYRAFAISTGFTSISLGSSLQYINGITNSATYGAFYGCSNIAGTLTLPSSLITIGDGTFRGCTKLSGNLVIPNNVTSVKYYAFYGCIGLTGTLTIGSSVASIGIYAFNGCLFTGTLTITASLTTIGEGSFVDCRFTALDTTASGGFTNSDYVLYDETVGGTVKALYSCVTYDGTLTLKSTTTRIGEYCFYNNLRTGTLTLTGSITTIGIAAFRYAAAFTGNLVIPNNIITIGDFAFSRMAGITGTISIGTGLTTIGPYSFEYSGISGALTIPNNVTSMAGYSFRNSPSLTSVSIGTGITSIGDYTFSACTSMSGTLSLHSGITSLGSGAFHLCAFTRVDAYRTTQPTTGTATFDNDAMALHCPTGTTSYNTAPWTTTAIFATLTKDL